MNRYESRNCTFVVPGDWVAEPPFAFREPGEEGNRMGAQILERTLAEMPSAALHAREQKLILAELYEGFEFLQEGPQRLEGPGEGYELTFRFLDEDENPSRGRMIYFTCGPLVCQLFLSGPEGEDRERDRLFESIAKTFAFQGAESLAGAKSEGLTPEIIRMPQTEAAKNWPGPWRKFPRCCVELPLPNAWDVAVDERDDVVFRSGVSEIRVHRELGEQNEAEAWVADRLARLQERGDGLLALEQGETEAGPYVMVLSDEQKAVRTWKTAAITWYMDVFVGDQQPLTFRLRAHKTDFPRVQPLLESLIASRRFLPPEEWETRIKEPWLDYVLAGAWNGQGPGVFARLRPTRAVSIIFQEESNFALTSIQSSLVDGILQGSGISTVVSSTESLGKWGHHEALSYSLDGSLGNQASSSVRALWLQAHGMLHGVILSGADREEVTGLFRSLVESISLPEL